MARKIVVESPQWGICVDHLDGSIGWIAVGSGEVFLSKSKTAAEKFLKELMENPKYSYSHPISVRQFTGFKK